jgi:hypothetical protein
VNSDSFLYIIAASSHGPVKLGISGDPERRVRQLQTGHAQRLQIYHQEPVAASQAPRYERLLHKDVAHLRSHGEWFNLTVDDALAHLRFTFIEHEPSDLIP